MADGTVGSLVRLTPTFFPECLVHGRASRGEDRFSDVCAKCGVKLCLAGHSHGNLYLGNHGGVEYWTKMSLYTLLYVDRDGFEFGPSKKIEVFAEDGAIELGRVDLWQRSWPEDWESCPTANSG